MKSQQSLKLRILDYVFLKFRFKKCKKSRFLIFKNVKNVFSNYGCLFSVLFLMLECYFHSEIISVLISFLLISRVIVLVLVPFLILLAKLMLVPWLGDWMGKV